MLFFLTRLEGLIFENTVIPWLPRMHRPIQPTKLLGALTHNIQEKKERQSPQPCCSSILDNPGNPQRPVGRSALKPRVPNTFFLK